MRPQSRFIKIKCLDCGNQQITFDRASSVVRCLVCGKVLVKPQGGKAKILAKVIETVD
ncbi:SSU ribosomal protein S27E [Methanothermus fervidus DSM 2088]|uniref:Small ribosomal subunit protein eS27 n=1 Tax=Methanothermus fervidus (strain ATCC 43054 / DSM 2088 / JCM 10308 / V24 S) TaxID=523846 RepID=E3GW53_METFV|nr:30S ribosomal protein S27e [Methanothermus fervidus]ADP77818.1 SSU ribosomal protein S27E [Methanothermus fervidus DSM 2088]